MVGVYLGPAVNLGLFGPLKERMVTPSYGSDPTVNYDIDGAVFDRFTRLDISAIVGLTYEWRELVFSLYGDFGLRATSTSDDIMGLIANATSGTLGEVKKIPNGHNAAYMLSVSYKLGSF